MDQAPRYWFAARRYGWGWGLPLTWQGWAVYVGWWVAFFGGLRALGLHGLSASHVIFILLMIGLLVSICYWKGQPPRWRWGN